MPDVPGARNPKARLLRELGNQIEKVGSIFEIAKEVTGRDVEKEVVGVSAGAEIDESIASHYSAENKKREIDTACISTMGLGGAYSSVIIEKY